MMLKELDSSRKGSKTAIFILKSIPCTTQPLFPKKNKNLLDKWFQILIFLEYLKAISWNLSQLNGHMCIYHYSL